MIRSAKQLATVICLVSGLAACSNTHTVSIDGGKGQATVTTDGTGSGTVKVNGPEGQSTMTLGSNASYPSNLPFPQYPSSKITLAMNQEGKQEATTISLDSADATEKIVAFYKNWFNSNGWKINAESSTSGMSSISAGKDKSTASIMTMPGAAGHNSIQIMMSTEK